MRFTHAIAALLLLTLACGAPDSPDEEVPSTDDGTSALVLASLSPNGDAAVRAGADAEKNYGSAPQMRVDAEHNGAEQEVFIQFKVDAIPAGTRSVKLVLSNDESGHLGTLFRTNSFTESTITWSNRPIKISTVTSPGWVTLGQRVRIDVTSVVSAPGIYAFAFSSNNGDGVVLRSREASSNRPALEFEGDAAPPPSPGGCSGASTECQVFALINQERTSRRLPALAWSSKLKTAASSHNQWMVANKCFAHVCPGEPAVGTRITNAGYSWSAYGETIAAGYPSPGAVVTGWMNSSGHRDILTSARLREVGVSLQSCSNCTYRTYWTADFGTAR